MNWKDYPTPLTDALIRSGPFSGPKDAIELWDRAVDAHEELERKLVCAVEVLIDLEHNVSRINRYRDAERHPDVGIALAKARTVIAALRDIAGDDRKGERNDNP